jgi:hypothetical protein
MESHRHPFLRWYQLRIRKEAQLIPADSMMRLHELVAKDQYLVAGNLKKLIFLQQFFIYVIYLIILRKCSYARRNIAPEKKSSYIVIAIGRSDMKL